MSVLCLLLHLLMPHAEAGLSNQTGGLWLELGGVVAGVDAWLSDSVFLGALAGFARSDIDADMRMSGATVENYHLGIYTGSRLGRLSLEMGGR